MTREPFLRLTPHEMDVHFIFDSHNLKPYFALDSIRKEYDGWQTDGKPTETMHFDGDSWAMCYDYDKMEFVAPRPHPDYHLESVPQFRIYFVAKDELYRGERADQSVRVKGGTITVRPRWPNMEKPDGTPIRGVPNLGHPYIDVQVQASNIEHDRYHELVKSVFSAWDVNTRYVGTPHEMSNINDMAVYCRIRRSVSSPVYAPDGPIARTHGLIEGGQSGYREHTEDHRKIPGYMVKTMIDADRVRELFRGHRLGKEVKHYYPKNPHNFEPDEPLFHPKLEVSYQTSLTDETLRWSEVDEAVGELEETVYNYLEWSGLPTRSSGDHFFSDTYFKAGREAERNVRLRECPLPEIEDEQEAAVMRLWGRMNDSDRDLIDSLVSDGGTPTREELSNRTGWSYRTVRRFVQRCEEVVSDTFDGLQIASKYEQSLLIERVNAAEQNFKNAVEDAVLTAAEAAEDKAASRWTKVKRRWGVTVREGELRDEIKIRHTPADRDEEITMLEEIRSAAKERFGSVRRLALTMTRHDGGTRRLRSLAEWIKPTAKTTNYNANKSLVEFMTDYLGKHPKDATERERYEANQAFKNR
jgi:hypothetical protein